MGRNRPQEGNLLAQRTSSLTSAPSPLPIHQHPCSAHSEQLCQWQCYFLCKWKSIRASCHSDHKGPRFMTLSEQCGLGEMTHSTQQDFSLFGFRPCPAYYFVLSIKLNPLICLHQPGMSASWKGNQNQRHQHLSHDRHKSFTLEITCSFSFFFFSLLWCRKWLRGKTPWVHIAGAYYLDTFLEINLLFCLNSSTDTYFLRMGCGPTESISTHTHTHTQCLVHCGSVCVTIYLQILFYVLSGNVRPRYNKSKQNSPLEMKFF